MITELICDFLTGYGLLSIIGDVRDIIRMYNKKNSINNLHKCKN